MFKDQYRRKRKTTKFRHISDNGYLDWFFHQNVFTQREYNFMLSGKDKGITICEELFRSQYTKLALNLITRKSLC